MAAFIPSSTWCCCPVQRSKHDSSTPMLHGSNCDFGILLMLLPANMNLVYTKNTLLDQMTFSNAFSGLSSYSLANLSLDMH